MIRLPKNKGGKTINKIVSTTDIYPTLMELCGTPVKHKLSGSSLTGLMQNPGDENWRNTAYSYW
jgi:arylsulfatase A-like enzyme